MGWMRYMFLGDWGQQMDIEEQRERVASMRRSLRGKRRKDADQDARLDELEAENEQMQLLVRSLVQVLVDKDLLTRREIADVVDTLDPADAQNE